MLSLPPGFEQAVMPLNAEEIRRVLGAKAYFKKYSLLNSPDFIDKSYFAVDLSKVELYRTRGHEPAFAPMWEAVWALNEVAESPWLY